jgi:hypothetical protein
MGTTPLFSRRERTGLPAENGLKKRNELFLHISRRSAMCQEDIGFQDISTGVEKIFQTTWPPGTGFHFVFWLEFDYSADLP